MILRSLLLAATPYLRVPALVARNVSHDIFICVTWLLRLYEITHAHAWHDLFVCVTWLMYMFCVTRLLRSYAMTHAHACQDVLVCVTWLIHMSNMAHSYLQAFALFWTRDPPRMKTNPQIGIATCHVYILPPYHIHCVTCLICATRLPVMHELTHAHAWHDSFVCVTWLIYMCNMSHSYLQAFARFGTHDQPFILYIVISYMWRTSLVSSYLWWVMLHIWMCHGTHISLLGGKDP